MPIEKLSAEEFIFKGDQAVILDVRSPGEFANGHIPGAHSFPLFTNEERAKVGTLYSKSGKEAALFAGLDIVGLKMSAFVKKAKALAPDKNVLVHCWRGGMRSASIAWLLEFSGFDVKLLEGGYKSYRAYIRESFTRPAKIVILSGRTGSGKTDVLKELKILGEQVLDLEGLANHKGSVFGHIGQKEQPSNEQFENDLADIWRKLDFNREIWIEDESHSIGNIFIPNTLFLSMKNAPIIRMNIPLRYRVERLIKEYAGIDDEGLNFDLMKLTDSLGKLAVKEMTDMINEKNYELFALKILEYYDKRYDFGYNKKQIIINHEIKPVGVTAKEQAEELLTFMELKRNEQ
jgi:tRNA 2-selenouridine synthase